MIAFLTGVLSPFSYADETSDVRCIIDSYRGNCEIEIVVPGDPRGPGDRGPGVPGERRCVKAGVEIPCEVDGGVWDAEYLCYMHVAVPQPSFDDPVWAGRTDGVVYRCVVGNVSFLVWRPSSVAVPPDPEVLARRAVDEMGLRAVDMGVFPHVLEELPSGHGFVGWNVWLWVRDASEVTWGPVSRTVSERGFSVTATAAVSGVSWEMGDGGVVSCGLGTAWQSFQVRNEKSPSCGYVYERTGEFTIRAVSHWMVNWSGIGESGVIEFDLSSEGHVDVVEVNVLNVPNRPR
ncbi:MAG: hypothetical protein Q4D79_05920 [Propionibacteriaceae bacterium]|nr:hypothetical protein [Propionibacteriaceae bacterium]